MYESLAELLNDMQIEYGNKKLNKILKNILSDKYSKILEELNKDFDIYYEKQK